ncbi:MAG: sugar phosphate isomerase/epimerase family protein, partial [Planctomycetota bacterium]
LGTCSSAITNAAILAASDVDFVEENVQTFLCPANSDEAAWNTRLSAARACGKPIQAANCFLPASLPCVGPQVDHHAIHAWAATAFRRAEQAGIAIIVFGSGGSRRIPADFDAQEAKRQFIDLLRKLAPMAEAHHVTLVIEPLNVKECNFINSLDEGAAIVRAVASPGVRLLADTFHMICERESPAAIVRAGSLLAHVHVAGPQRVPPTMNGHDFRPYFRALTDAGYSGMISIEASWSALASQLAPATVELREQAATAALTMTTCV